MINLCSSRYSLFFGKHKCDCGKEHDFNAHCLLEHGAFGQIVSFISDVTPLMSRVALFYDDEKLMLRLFEHIKRDYRVVCYNVDDDKRRTELIALPEDIKLIIGIGNKAVDSAKYKAHVEDVPVIVASLPCPGMLTSRCVMNDEGMYAIYEVNEPWGYVFDLNWELTDKEKASLFGTVASGLNMSFDYYFSALIYNDDYCPFIAGAIVDIAAKTILCMGESMSPNNELLLEAALKIALIARGMRFSYGGESQCGLSYSMLNSGEYTQGELQFIFSAVLSPLFKSHIQKRSSFTPPPDNNYRLEQISELFGVSEYKALSGIVPQIKGKDAAIAEYKIREYSCDMLEKLNRNISLYKSAFKIFKRLYSDDGYSLGEFQSGDISLCIALAPDIIRGDGMLTELKRLGELDRYIV